MHAILLAGDSKFLQGMNKAFLPLAGWPLFVHVLRALDGASQVDAISIIGPQKPIIERLEKALPTFLFTKKIEVLEQKQTLFENIVYAYGCALGNGRAASWTPNSPAALFVPSDIPLVTSQELDAFITGSDTKQYDYFLGVTAASYLERFYPTAHRPGIQMAYLYLKDQAYRMNNLHIARLCSLTAGPFFQKMYNHRHQRSPWNRLKMIKALLTEDQGTEVLSLYLRAQAAVLLMQGGWTRLSQLCRNGLVRDEIERAFSNIFNIRFRAVEVNIGGAALDIDDEATYRTMASVFLQWSDLLSPPDPFCPFATTCPEGI